MGTFLYDRRMQLESSHHLLLFHSFEYCPTTNATDAIDLRNGKVCRMSANLGLLSG